MVSCTLAQTKTGVKKQQRAITSHGRLSQKKMAGGTKQKLMHSDTKIEKMHPKTLPTNGFCPCGPCGCT